MKNIPLLKINELIKRKIIQLLKQYYKEETAYITIISVNFFYDSHSAQIFYSSLNQNKNDKIKIECFLKKIKKVLQIQLNKSLRLKYYVKIFFYYSNIIEKESKVGNIINNFNKSDIF